jgi:NAD(P)-dependent dehydrogenase (short-subunit alcohol dehydrogenase family)
VGAPHWNGGAVTDRLDGKVALVTGAALERGIGRGIALTLADYGADVAVNDVAHDEEALRRVREIEERGRRSAYVKADVSVPEEAGRMVAEVVEYFGRLDIFVSNAGVQTWQELADVTPEAWDWITGVNLHGAFYGCRAAAEQMRGRGGGGRIVLISSVHASMPFASMGVYGATKQAVAVLAGVMAREWARDGITVNHVAPGWVDSDINRDSPGLATEAARRATLASIPLGHRPAEPREIGEAVAFFAADRASYVTGAHLRVDAGLVIGKY